MKFTKLSAAGATIALAAGSVLGIGIAANAIDVPLDEIGVETSPYTDGEWFLGNPVGPALTQDATGLTIPGRNQLLYGWSVEPISGADFTEFIEATSFVGTEDTLNFQVPVFFDGTANSQFTTLRPAVAGSPTTATAWISSQSVPDLGLVANTEYPFATIAAAFDAAGDAEILAFGVLVNAETSAVLESVTVFDETWTFATPTVVVPPVVPPAVVPTPIQKPVTFTG